MKFSLVTPEWIASRFRTLFWESMSETVQESVIPPYDAMVEANAIVIQGKEQQELFYSSQYNLNDFFIIHFPDLVSFDNKGLQR